MRDRKQSISSSAAVQNLCSFNPFLDIWEELFLQGREFNRKWEWKWQCAVHTWMLLNFITDSVNLLLPEPNSFPVLSAWLHDKCQLSTPNSQHCKKKSPEKKLLLGLNFFFSFSFLLLYKWDWANKNKDKKKQISDCKCEDISLQSSTFFSLAFFFPAKLQIRFQLKAPFRLVDTRIIIMHDYYQH